MILAIVAFTATAFSSTREFGPPLRPVAPIVSPTWWEASARDAAHEVEQISALLGLKPGATIADIGAGNGYDTLRLARLVGPNGLVIGEDVTPGYLVDLRKAAARAGLRNIRTIQGLTGDPKLPPRSIDAAIMVHMYHEIARPYDLLYHLASAFLPGGRLGIEELDRPTQFHGTPPALLVCELQAVGYRRLSLSALRGGLGYFAVFAPPAPGTMPRPDRIATCSPKALPHRS